MRTRQGGLDNLPPYAYLIDIYEYSQKQHPCKEGRKHITVRAEIPGMDKKDLDISLENGILKIEGEKRQDNEETRG
ncbi:MAG: Hsp20/alpha crystallin family protein [bacterium]